MRSNKCNLCSREKYLINLGSLNFCMHCIFNEIKFKYENDFFEVVMRFALYWENEHKQMNEHFKELEEYQELKRKGKSFLRRNKNE